MSPLFSRPNSLRMFCFQNVSLDILDAAKLGSAEGVRTCVEQDRTVRLSLAFLVSSQFSFFPVSRCPFLPSLYLSSSVFRFHFLNPPGNRALQRQTLTVQPLFTGRGSSSLNPVIIHSRSRSICSFLSHNNTPPPCITFLIQLQGALAHRSVPRQQWRQRECRNFVGRTVSSLTSLLISPLYLQSICHFLSPTLSATHTHTHRSPLHWAAISGFIQLVHFLDRNVLSPLQD